MTVSLSPVAKCQFNQGGIPLAGGLLFTYAAGTTTKLATYKDAAGAVPNTNPVVLDANGQCSLYLSDGVAYKLVLSPSTDTDPPSNAFWTADGIANNVLPLNPTFNNLIALGTLVIGGAVTITSGTVSGVALTATNAALTTPTLSGGTLNGVALDVASTGVTATPGDISNKVATTQFVAGSVAAPTTGSTLYSYSQLGGL